MVIWGIIMIYIFGDLHGYKNLYKFDDENFLQGEDLTRDDYVIILGDFGIPFYNIQNPTYLKELDALKKLSDKPWTTLFIDGNHENFDNLLGYPIIDKFGGKVGQLQENIYHLKRGYVYNINSAKFFCLGGAESFDKRVRKANIDWWENECPSTDEYDFAIDNLNKIDFNVDYVLTHTITHDIISKILNTDSQYLIRDSVSQFLEHIKNKLIFKHWFFGHFRTDYLPDNKFTCLYNYYAKCDIINNVISYFNNYRR